MKTKIFVIITGLTVIGAGIFAKTSMPSITPPVVKPKVNVLGDTTSAKTYTLSEVSGHKDAMSCWSAINGKVYDITSFINQHPGGAQAILSICGVDGSAAFNMQHGGQSRPANELTSLYIGDLAQ